MPFNFFLVFFLSVIHISQQRFAASLYLQAYGKLNIAHEVHTQNETPWLKPSLALNYFDEEQ